MKTLIKILACPFIFGLLLITHNVIVVTRTWKFLKYGGEVNLYIKDDRASIDKIYRLLQKKFKDHPNNPL